MGGSGQLILQQKDEQSQIMRSALDQQNPSRGGGVVADTDATEEDNNTGNNGISRSNNNNSDKQKKRTRRRRPRRRMVHNKRSRMDSEEEDFRKDADVRIRPFCSVIPTTNIASFQHPQAQTMTKKTRSRSLSLPHLLLERETYGGSGHLRNKRAYSTTSSSWMSRMITTTTMNRNGDDNVEKDDQKKDDQKTTSYFWRPYCHRRLHFRELGTSPQDAVLALDGTGSMIVALSSSSENNNGSSGAIIAQEPDNDDDDDDGGSDGSQTAALVLRFYGLPSPTARQQQQTSSGSCIVHKNTNTLLLLTVPLLLEDNGRESLTEDRYYFRQAVPAPIRVGVSVSLSHDGRFAMAISCDYCTSSGSSGGDNEGENILFNATVFPLPRALNNYSSPLLPCIRNDPEVLMSWKLYNIPLPSHLLGSYGNSIMQRSLWSVDYFPDKRENHRSIESANLCKYVIPTPAYLVFLDEQDGFRLTWFQEATWNPSTVAAGKPFRQEIWTAEKSTSSKKHGIVLAEKNSAIVVPVPDVDAGWELCASNRQSGAIRAGAAGSTTAENNVTTNRPAAVQSPSLGIAFTAFFSTTALLHDILRRRPSLVQPRFQANSMSLPNFSYHIVGLNGGGRTLEILLVFSVGPPGKGCVGIFVEVDLLTQNFRELEFVRQTAVDTPPLSCDKLAIDRRRKRVKEGQDLYPDCQSIDNLAVRRGIPVMSLKSKHAPVEVVYQ